MAKPNRILVLAVDFDDDLGEKARIRGPVVGRDANAKAGTLLAIADPEESDANTMFKAVKEYDEVSKEYECQVATITGSSSLGFKAERELVEQLEKVLAKFPADSCIFVSDGASDEQILPLVQTRVKLAGVRTVTVKQTKELEKTYFVILEKLKEPHYARIVFGIPGIALLLYFLLPFLVPAIAPHLTKIMFGILGAYLIVKGFGIEEAIIKSVSYSRISLESPSFIFQFASASLLVVSLFAGVLSPDLGGLKTILILTPIALLLLVAGSTAQAVYEKKNYLLAKQANYAAAVILLGTVLNQAFEWVVGNIGFGEFFEWLILSAAAMFLVTQLAKGFRSEALSAMHLEGTEVYTEIGGRVGKISGVNAGRSALLVQTKSGQKIDFGFDQITRIGEKIIVRY
ncbi:MAG: DUF373 family protein [Candidatus Micrarchaeia archaeon]|jgi:putative membrane protein